ncbi:Histone-lysine N-methyltransferase ash1 [Madurella mycetomatis]|uniref:Histone-lysine N-methyltransferase ash1 n=1 Tax=Madurella mycetomatis TaxID=100816 RepID=A0A175VQ67_9PEZI|nr:Histone-lysine N-methyltransferase ash1 [Madurella mycetomatis]
MAAVDMGPAMADLGSLLCESSFSSTPTDASSSNAASLSSTPPTTVSPDSMSLASEPDVPKPESDVVSSIEAAISSIPLSENEQHESGQQTPLGQDAIVVAEQPPAAEPAPTSRPRRARSSLPVYNLAKLSGSGVHGRRRANGDAGQEKRRRTISGDTLASGGDASADDADDAKRASRGGIDALDRHQSIASVSTPRSARIAQRSGSSQSPAHITRRATRLSGASVETMATKLSALGRRGKKSVNKGLGRLSRELRRLQDTNEFAHIDTRPVRYTVWSNGKYVDMDATQAATPEPPRKKARVDGDTADAADKTAAEKQEPGAPVAKTRRVKKWLEKGLYAGQEAPIDIFKGLTSQERKKLASLPELMPSGKQNRTLPMPMFNGLRILINGRDFKLPFDVCNPLPPGQPKPAAYRTMTKNRFVGDAAAYWKKTPHFEDFASKCVCKPQDGCAEDCQNRIMLYECDETNCNVGKAFCTNRAFQDLQERTKKGGRYRVGVEVVKTADRGYGVRSNRCFEANQIIMEYTGEIITEEECERRMNEVYKDNECYYLMSFDQNMIIDATTGSIARFVNHSCSPNCRMIKWIVSGQPRMALFAGDRPIMTGEELTYDYNFDPFSAKNVQKCLCGSPNCRGVLGPKPKEVKPPKDAEKKPVKAVKSVKIAKTVKSAKSVKSSVKEVKATGKRKLKDLFDFDGSDEDEASAKVVKKRKVLASRSSNSSSKVSASLKRTLSSTAKGAAKGAVTKIRRGVSSISMARKTKTVKKVALTTSKGANTKARVKAKPKAKVALTSKTTMTTTVARGKAIKKTKTHGKKTAQKTLAADTPLRSPSLTIVAAGVDSAEKAAATPTPDDRSESGAGTTKSARKWTPSWKARENVAAAAAAATTTPEEKAGSALSSPRSVKSATKIRVVVAAAVATAAK